MSLYYYVKDRDHLLALARRRRHHLEAIRCRVRSPPGTIPLFALQPIYSIGPHGLALFDHLVGLLRRAGLPHSTVAHATIALVEYLCGHLIGHLPQTRPPGHDHAATVDDILASLPQGAAPNIRALGPELRRAASTLQPLFGIALLLSGLRHGSHSNNQEP